MRGGEGIGQPIAPGPTLDGAQHTYPLAASIPQEVLDGELAELEELRGKPLPLRLAGYLKLGGPGFMNAALTLGAGTLTATMLAGATLATAYSG